MRPPALKCYQICLPPSLWRQLDDMAGTYKVSRSKLIEELIQAAPWTTVGERLADG